MNCALRLYGTVSGHVRVMWWIDASDETTEPPHVCTDECTRMVDASWVCTFSGTILGPAMLAPPDIASSPASHVPRTVSTSKEWTTRARFRSAAQHVIDKLFSGTRRSDVETARAERGRSLAKRAALRSVADDVAAGRLPNVGRALCAFWTVYERTTSAVDAAVTISIDTETMILRKCVEFYAQNIQSHNPDLRVSESRQSHEAIALATLYMMRDGVPGILEKNLFVCANLPDLARLKNYGYPIGRYTHARRLIQLSLEHAYDQKKD